MVQNITRFKHTFTHSETETINWAFFSHSFFFAVFFLFVEARQTVSYWNRSSHWICTNIKIYRTLKLNLCIFVSSLADALAHISHGPFYTFTVEMISMQSFQKWSHIHWMKSKRHVSDESSDKCISSWWSKCFFCQRCFIGELSKFIQPTDGNITPFEWITLGSQALGFYC